VWYFSFHNKEDYSDNPLFFQYPLLLLDTLAPIW
jgi:hypothetical protein